MIYLLTYLNGGGGGGAYVYICFLITCFSCYELIHCFISVMYTEVLKLMCICLLNK